MKTYLALMALTTSVILTTFPMTNRLTDYHPDYDQQLLTTLHKLDSIEKLLNERTPKYATPKRITHYGPTGHRMANGEWPYIGAAASSDRTIPFGTHFIVHGTDYVIKDRTALWVHKKFGSTLDIYDPHPETR